MIPFLRLSLTDDAEAVHAAIARVLERGWFVLGPELEAFEREFASACGAPHAVGVGTGTDALADRAPRPRHRPRRRSDHVAAVGRVFGAGRS